MNTDTRTDAELNRIIAEWMGWVIAINPNHCHLENAGRLPNGPFDGWQEIPSYCTDLNVIHEAENKWCEQPELDDDEMHPKYAYVRYLYNIVVPLNRQPFRATARQRAEALVAVIQAS